MMSGRLPILASAALGMLTASMLYLAAEHKPVQSKPELNFEFFRTRVEPIFLEKRPGHSRCYICHAESNNNFRLEKLSPAARSWTEEQSRRNFETVSKLVNPGDPDNSWLLLQPLAPEGGGNVFHSGGRQFASKNDPGWKTLAHWINGAKPDGRPKR
jgi:hypothetical protein